MGLARIHPSGVRATIIIPIFNEESLVEAGLAILNDQLEKYEGLEYELLFVENGSTDNTLKLLEEATAKNPAVKVYHLDRADYGNALREGLNKAVYEHIMVFQIDLLPFDFFNICLFRDHGKAIILGVRNDPSMPDPRPGIRRFLTKGLGWTLYVLFGSRFSDTHGAKYIHLPSVLGLVGECKLDGGIFETELVLRANYTGLPIGEIPVPSETYSPPKKSYIYKIARNIKLVMKMYIMFRAEGLTSKPSTDGRRSALSRLFSIGPNSR